MKITCFVNFQLFQCMATLETAPWTRKGDYFNIIFLFYILMSQNARSQQITTHVLAMQSSEVRITQA